MRCKTTTEATQHRNRLAGTLGVPDDAPLAAAAPALRVFCATRPKTDERTQARWVRDKFLMTWARYLPGMYYWIFRYLIFRIIAAKVHLLK